MRRLYTEVRSVEPNEMARARVQEEVGRTADQTRTTALLAATRPSAVDNSTLAWFPPIGDQGYQNSCVAWAVGYYYDTYTQARDEGLDVSNGDSAHICSPSFLYPLLNDGLDEGAYLEAAVAKLSVIGCSSLALTPYTPSNHTTWPSEAAWVEALARRTVNAHWIAGNTDSGLEAVKQLLANGGVAVVFVDIYANLYYDYPQGSGVDNDVLYAPAGAYHGGHALTLVGYDDSRTYRDERDGQIRTGAFLLANSWGSDWGIPNTGEATKGFLWIGYSAFREQRFVYDPVYTDDRPGYRPTAYALAGLDYSQRGYLTLSGGAGLPSAPTGVTSAVLDNCGGTTLAVDSSQRIAVDLTDVASPVTADRVADLFIAAEVSYWTAPSGVITSVEFFIDPDGDGVYSTSSAPHVPVTVAYGSIGYGFLPIFNDLDWDHWAYESIEACYVAGVVSGYPEGDYMPTAAVTRDQMATYIARALAGGDDGIPAGSSTPTFSDVPADYWAYDYIEYAVANQVVIGYADGSYQPVTSVDRGQMAVFIARAMADPADRPGLDSYDPPATPTFTDVPLSFWAYRYVEYLADPVHGVAGGYADGCYHPEYTCTRDQMAAFVARAFSLEG